MKPNLAVLCALAIALLSGCHQSGGGGDGTTVDAQAVARSSLAMPMTDNFGDRTPVSYVRQSDPRSQDEINAAACSGPRGEWRCKAKKPAIFASAATTPITPPTWTVRDWYINPANIATAVSDSCASDGNTCTSATCVGGCSGSTCPSGQGACLTFGEVIQHRLGTFTPRLQQITIFHKLSAQVPGQDLIFFDPYTAAGGQAQLIDTLVPLDGGMDVQITDAAFLAKQPDAAGGGQLLQISGLPAGITAGMFVCDVTQGNSCAFIDSVPDAGVAKMQQPLTDASFLMPSSGLPTAVEVNGWTPGDTVNVFTENATNLKRWHCSGGDVSDAGLFSGCWTQFTNVLDLGTGSPPSELPLVAEGINGIAGSKVDPRVHISYLNGRGNGAYLFGNFHTGTVIQIVGGGSPYMFGGGTVNGFTSTSGFFLEGDTIVHGTWLVEGPGLFLRNVFTDATTFQLGNAGIGNLGSARLGGPLYGTAALNLFPGSVFTNPAWGNYFLTGAMTLNSATTGCFVSGLDAGAITCNVPVTQPNLVTNHTIKSLNNGATFTDGTGNNND